MLMKKHSLIGLSLAGFAGLLLAWPTGGAVAQTTQPTVQGPADTGAPARTPARRTRDKKAQASRTAPQSAAPTQSARAQQLTDFYNTPPKYVGETISYGSGGGWEAKDKTARGMKRSMWDRQSQGEFDSQ
jgi:hypothetical protein